METYWVWEYGLFEKNPKRQDSLNPETTLEVVKAADAQATIAALQARVNGLEKDSELLRQSRDDFRVKYESVKNDAITLQSQLTQRTAELEAARRKVDLAEKKAWLAAHDVGFFSMWNGTDHSGPPKLALLCNDTFAWATADAEDVLDEQIDTIVELFKSEGEAGVIKWIAQQRNMKPMESVGKWLFGCDAIKKERDDLQAELERVRGELAETKLYLQQERANRDSLAACVDRDVQTIKELRTLIAALPRVEGEVTVRDITALYWTSDGTYGSIDCKEQLVSLLQERQKLC